jgi:hypothetical protein
MERGTATAHVPFHSMYDIRVAGQDDVVELGWMRLALQEHFRHWVHEFYGHAGN